MKRSGGIQFNERSGTGTEVVGLILLPLSFSLRGYRDTR